jgi:hypothetical protein
LQSKLTLIKQICSLIYSNSKSYNIVNHESYASVFPELEEFEKNTVTPIKDQQIGFSSLINIFSDQAKHEQELLNSVDKEYELVKYMLFTFIVTKRENSWNVPHQNMKSRKKCTKQLDICFLILD